MSVYDDYVLTLSPKVHLTMMGLSGTTVPDSSGTGRDFTAQGGIDVDGLTAMAELAGPPTVPNFDNNAAHYLSCATPTISNKAAFAISAWVMPTLIPVPLDVAGLPSYPTQTCVIYSERAAGLQPRTVLYVTFNGSGSVWTIGRQNDTGAFNTRSSHSIYRWNWWNHVVVLADTTATRMYLNGYLISVFTGTPGNPLPAVTQTLTGMDARIGADRVDGNPWRGPIHSLSLWDTVAPFKSGTTWLDDKVRAMYDLGWPVNDADHNKPLLGMFFAPNAWVNQRVPKAPVLDTSQSTATIQADLLNQKGAGIGFNGSATKVYDVPEATPTQRVAIWGGRYANSRVDKEGLWQAFGDVPVPDDAMAAAYSAGYGTGGVRNAQADQHMTIIRRATSGEVEAWEMWKMWKKLGRSSFGCTVTLSSGGTIPAGTYQWAISAFNDNGNSQPFASAAVTVNGSQQASCFGPQMLENPIPTDDTIDGFRLWRRMTAPTPGNWQYVRDVPVPGNFQSDGPTSNITIVDDGSFTPISTSYTTVLPQDEGQTESWAMGLGGYHADLRTCLGHFDVPGRTDWGGTATSILKMCGQVTLRELAAGYIPHGLFLGSGYTNGVPKYPAQRTDGRFSFRPLSEGNILWLPRTVDISGFIKPVRIIARALQEFGGVIADFSPLFSIYIEPPYGAGRDYEYIATEGRGLSYPGILSTLPIEQCVVLDPQTIYNRAHTAPPQPPIRGVLANRKMG